MNCIAIVDGNYLTMIAKRHFNKRHSHYPHSIYSIFEKYQRGYCQNLHLSRIRYHDSPAFLSERPTPDQKREYDKKNSYFKNHYQCFERTDLILGRCVKRNNSNGDVEYGQKGVDVNIAIDIIQYSSTVSTLMIFTCDSDIIPAFNLGRKNGAEIILVTSKNTRVSSGGSVEKLIHASDVHLLMDESDFNENNKSPLVKKYSYLRRY